MTGDHTHREPSAATLDSCIAVQKVAETLNCTYSTVYSLVTDGFLKAIEIGPGTIRISEQSLREFLSKTVRRPVDPPSRKDERPASLRTRTRVAKSMWMSDTRPVIDDREYRGSKIIP